MKLQPEVVLEDRVRDIAAKPQEAKKHLAGIQQAMGQITGQMRKLSEHKRNTGVQINSMSSFSAPNSALMAAEALAEKLLQGRSQYAMWANMLTAQGNARSAMVRNLLGVEEGNTAATASPQRTWCCSKVNITRYSSSCMCVDRTCQPFFSPSDFLAPAIFHSPLFLAQDNTALPHQ